MLRQFMTRLMNGLKIVMVRFANSELLRSSVLTFSNFFS